MTSTAAATPEDELEVNVREGIWVSRAPQPPSNAVCVYCGGRRWVRWRSADHKDWALVCGLERCLVALATARRLLGG